jgi:hypothetical protein
MKKFRVRFIRDTTESADVEIEAASEDEAKELAEDMRASDDLEWYRNDGSAYDTRVDDENIEEVED